MTLNSALAYSFAQLGLCINLYITLMFGAFRPTALRAFQATHSTSFQATGIASGGLLHKRPNKLNRTRKQSLRYRLQAVDENIAAVAESGIQCRAVTEALRLPTEQEMLPKDKYTTFSMKVKGYRKGIHNLAKWTRTTYRVNPKGF